MILNVFVFNVTFSRLVSMYNLAYQQYRRQACKTSGLFWPQLWVLCDGKDRNHIAYISVSFHSVKQRGLQSSFADSLQPDQTGEAEDDQYIAAGYIITTRGTILI